MSCAHFLSRFFQDLKDMMGFTPLRYYYFMWKYVTPLLLLTLLSASTYQLAKNPPTYSAWNQKLVGLSYIVRVWKFGCKVW